jgi:hypothetical protein
MKFKKHRVGKRANDRKQDVSSGFSFQDNRQETVQRKPNKTGLPDDLKLGLESLSGYSMDDVKVHYNSSRPAQVNARAFAQGNQIHLASGQEKHLPHEAWHVTQQKQGRVQPTMTFNGAAINDDAGLEKEADVMGRKAVQQNYAFDSLPQNKDRFDSFVHQRVSKEDYGGNYRTKFIKVKNKIKDSRGGYSDSQVDRILREVPKEDMDVILSWPNEDIEHLKWNIHALDILRNPLRYMTNLPKYHTLRIYFADLSGSHAADMPAASDAAIASITKTYSQGSYIMNALVAGSEAEADVKVYVLGPATLKARLKLSIVQQMQFTRQRAWTPGHGDSIYVNRTVLPPTNSGFAATVAHEVGHALGLDHPDALSIEATQPNIMNQTATGLLAEVASQEQLKQIRSGSSRGKISLG